MRPARRAALALAGRVHRPPPRELDRERAAARRLAVLAPAVGHPAAPVGSTAPDLRGRAYTDSSRYIDIRLEPFEQEVPGLAGVTVAWEAGCTAVAGPRAGRTARAGVLARARRAELAGAGRVSRGGRDPRRGSQAGAPARPHLRSGAPRGQGRCCGEDAALRSRSSTIPRARALRCWSASRPAAGTSCSTGGSTPRAAYGEFVEAVRTVGIDVSRCAMWFSDERCVPPDDERSNYAMVRASLLEPLGRSASRRRVHRMRGELGPIAAADEYERELRDAGRRDSIWCCSGSGPTGISPRCSPTRRRCPSGRGWWSACEQAGARAVRVARDADLPGAGERAPDRVPGHRRVQGGSGRGGVRPGRQARSARALLAAAGAGARGEGAAGPDPVGSSSRSQGAHELGHRRRPRRAPRWSWRCLRGREIGESVLEADRSFGERSADRSARGDGRADPAR